MRPHLLVVLASLAATLVPHPASARGPQAGGAWEVVPSPNTGSPNNQLYGVAAIGPDEAWAVGAYGDLGIEARQVIQRWDGTRWSLADSPLPTAFSELTAVCAVDSKDVWAVGGYDTGGQALIEHWNGSVWSVVAHPNPGQFNRFFGVAARSSADVWAVGLQHDGGLQKTLVEHWGGSSWTVVPSPNIAGQHNQLYSVTAVPGSPNEAWAVGSAGSSPVIMRWNGAQWSLVQIPSAGFNPRLNGVVALSANDVWAVGYSGGGAGTITLTMHWNGSVWSVVPSPNPGPAFNYLRGVAGAASNDVWAVGDSDEGGDGKTLILRWNGTAWVQVPGDNTGPSGLAFALSAVSAVGGNDVWSVGTNSHALAEHWNGAQWSSVSAANAGVGNNVLNAVSGSSPSDVWGVGYFTSGTERRTLIEHWNGAAWNIVQSPNTNKRLNELKGIVALSPSDAWAAGNAHSGDALDQTTLILHWDGTSWSIVQSPNPGPAFNSLRGIAANAADDIWAAGGFGDADGPFKVLIEHWDGRSWAAVPGVNPPTTNNELYGVTALAADDVWAVGYHGEFEFTTLIEHWDGSQWSVVQSPNPAVSSNVLYAVSASGANDVWAVGSSKNLITGIGGTLTERSNGDLWSLAFGINDFFSTLYGVAAVSPQEAWQVGDFGGLSVIGRWNGSTWNVVPSPEVEGRLLAVTAVTPCDVWAVGQRSGPEAGLFQTLSLHYQLFCDAVWSDLGHALAGAAGEPVLMGSGPLTAGSTASLTLSQAASSAPSVLLVAAASQPVPFLGGTLVAFPPVIMLPLTTSPLGRISLTLASWPAGLSGSELFFQCAILDAAAVQGVALSNALQADVP